MHSSNAMSAAPHLSQRNFQTGRRAGADRRRRSQLPIRHEARRMLQRDPDWQYRLDRVRRQTGDRSLEAAASVRLAVGTENAPRIASTETVPHKPSSNSGKRDERTRCVATPACNAVVGPQPFAGQRTPGAKLARHAGQKPGRADVGKKADVHFRHRKQKLVACHAMRTMNRDADAPAHHDAVKQCDVRLSDSA